MSKMIAENKIKLTVCIATYNQEKYIATCLQSIVSQQTGFDFEMIIGDDASRDGTRNIINEFAAQYPERIRCVFHEKNIGATQNLQEIHKLATGEYVAHCDGDDSFLPGKLQLQADYLDANPDVVQAWHKMYLVNGDDKVMGILPRRFGKFLQKKLSLKDLALAYFSIGYHSSLMYRRSAKSVYDRETFTIDYFYALDIGSRGKSAHMNSFLGNYRSVPGNSLTTSLGSMIKVNDAVAETAQHFARLYPDLYPVFYGNLWFKTMLIKYAGDPISEKYKNIFATFKPYRNFKYALASMKNYVDLYASLSFAGMRKKLFKPVKTIFDRSS
ncbi:MAG: glycosyltransferase [Ferruginibacter sp.]